MQMQIFRRAVFGLMALGLTLGMLAILSCSSSDDEVVTRQATLLGTTEVPVVPNTPGSGEVILSISDNADQISYVLTYRGLTNVQQAHIHAGSPTERGGIILYLCTNLGNAPAGAAGAQACPSSAGTVAGVLTSIDLVQAPAQGNTPAINTFADAVGAILGADSYTNIHTQANPGGEIRGQNLALQ